ncbi:platelet glycoprotein Ib alpha chain [Vombatus ursinus]|uniref:LRRCT domain-containing protein n=1 Tax=Vombatus ursinus TaxID=29139 RepID=A0A4X2JR23_VOMUR|nr:platelet glycoprotein Ib alpha chain [Vombatus ursinus]
MDPRLLLVFLFLFLLSASHSQTPCESHEVASKLETNCESLGLKSVPLKLPPKTTTLLLQKNDLKSFSTSSLSLLTQLTELNLAKNNMSVLVADEKLPLLSILDLSDNDLQTLPQLRYFLPSLTSLDLSRNALKSLSAEILAGLDCLENLYLRGNELRSLPPNFLKAARKLEKLDLANNYLEQLSADLLADLENLNTLFLQNNLLSVLPAGFFENNLFLSYVFLHSNPWNCSCEFRYLHDWLQENWGNVYLWKEGMNVKVMTPTVESVECEVPFRTPAYNFSLNCPITVNYAYDSYDKYDGLTVKGVPESETTTIPNTVSLEHSTVLNRSKMTMTELTTSPKTAEKTTFPNPQRSTIFLNPKTAVFPTMPELTRLFISSEAPTIQVTSEPTTFSENLETTRPPTSPEAITFPVTSEKAMLQTTPELVTFPATNSIAHTSPLPVTSPSLSSTLTLLNSKILPPNEALGSSGDPSNSSPLSISCCLFSLRFYIFGIAWVLVSSIVLILFLALAQPPPHLPRTHAFMEDIPKPQATVHLELLKGKEVIVPRACLLYLEGLIPSFRTRLFLWVQSNGRVGPLTLKRKPSAISLGRGGDLLGSVSIRYSGHSL